MMSDLIDRQAAIDAFDMPIFNIKGKENADAIVNYLRTVLQRIKELPPAQPEIIRCKNCKHYEDNSFCGNEESTFVDVEPDSFCSWAERKEE